MRRRAVSEMMLIVLLTSVLMSASNIPHAEGSGPIYIRADGSVDPPTAPIQRDGDTYTLASDIYDPIVVERNNIIIDGNGNTLQGTGADESKGIDLSWMTGVTVENTEVTNFYYGIYLDSSYDNVIRDNDMTNNRGDGIKLSYSSENTVTGNNMTRNLDGIGLVYSEFNIICENNASDNTSSGIYLWRSNYNTIISNKVWLNNLGIWLGESSGNTIYHNGFIDNNQQFGVDPIGYANGWDDGYPYGGNYWSDYTVRYPDADVMEGSSIWNTPYVMDADNQDPYPLVFPRITGIDPSLPIAGSGKQLISLLGEGFVPDSKVTLAVGSDIRHIPNDRTLFISPNRIEIIAGLTEGLWKASVTNYALIQSNEFAFQVRGVSIEDGKKALELALQYTKLPYEWTVEDAAKMAAIAGPESGWRANAAFDEGGYSVNYIGQESWGLWQIFMRWHLDKLARLGAPIDPPYDQTVKWLLVPENNVKAAYEVWHEAKEEPGATGFEPWAGFTSGKWKLEPWYGVFRIKTSVYKCPVNVTITDNYGRIVSETENQIPEASYAYFNTTDTKIFYLPSNLTYQVQLNGTDYGNCTIGQAAPTESVHETAFSQVTFNLTSETVAVFSLLSYNANYTLKVDENGDGLSDFELVPEVSYLTTEYDLGVAGMNLSSAAIGAGYNLIINVTVTNYGVYDESFNVTVYANTTIIETKEFTLANGSSTTATFTWGTAGFAEGNYTISAYVEPIFGETITSDNTYIGGSIIVTIPGDVNGDCMVDALDLAVMNTAYGSTYGSSNWNPDCDFNDDGNVDVLDLFGLGINYGKST